MARRVHRAESSLWLALIAAAIWVPLLDGAVLPVDQQEALNQGSATSGLPTNLAMQAFFDQLDNNRDGQLQQQELHAAAVSLGSADATAAATAMIHKLDSVDSGLDVSMTELDEHLHQVLKGVKLSDWIAHGLGLPQYADAFERNGITVLDFPLLVKDGGQLLEAELQIYRQLHRQRILRAMQRQMLGLGAAPSHVQDFLCGASSIADPAGSAGVSDASSTTAAAAAAVAEAAAALVKCSWLEPVNPGQPPLHKYVLQRISLGQPGSAWQVVAELSHDGVSWFYDTPAPGQYQYRLAAWNPYGRSGYTVSNQVTVAAMGTVQRPSARSAAAAGVAAGGVVGSAGRGDAEDGNRAAAILPTSADAAALHQYGHGMKQVSSDVQARQQLQQTTGHQTSASSAGTHQPAAARTQLQSLMYGVLPVAQQASSGSSACASQKIECSFSSTRAAHRTTSDGRQHQPRQSSGSRGWPADMAALPIGHEGSASKGAGNSIIIITPDAMQGPAVATAAAAAAAAAAVTGCVEPGQPMMPSGHDIRRQAEPDPGTSRDTTASLAPVKSSVWSGWLGNWLWAAVNSLALLVLPVCVRLLPVSVLSQLAGILAFGLQLLPPMWQQTLLLRRHHSFGVGSSNSNDSIAASSPEPVAETSKLVSGSCQYARCSSFTKNTCDSSSSPESSNSNECRSNININGCGAIGQHTESGNVLGTGGTESTLREATTKQQAGFGVQPAGSSSSGPDALLHTVRVQSSPGAPRGGARCPGSSRNGSEGGSPAGSTNVACLPHSQSELLLSSYMGPSASSVNTIWGPTPGRSSTLGAVHKSSSSGVNNGELVSVEEQLLLSAGDSAASLLGASCSHGSGTGEARSLCRPGTFRQQQQLQRQQELGSSMHLGAVMEQASDKRRCAFPRCTQLFDLRHLKALMGRHYCGRCQQAFCMQHTAYSPHGSTGSCGAESRCVCITCFYDFTPEYRMFLSSRNTLISRRTNSGPARQESIPGLRGSFKSIAAAASGMTVRQQQQQDSITAVSSLEGWGSTTAEGTGCDPPCSGRCTAGDETMSSMEQSCGEDPGSKCAWGDQLTSQDAVGTAYKLPSDTLQRANRVRNVLLWGRAWAKASAVVRFKRAAELTQANSNRPAL